MRSRQHAQRPITPLTVTHQVPPRGSAVTPCCGRTVFELPRTDRVTKDPALVTCLVRATWAPEPA